MNLDKRVPVGTAVVITRDNHVLLGKRLNAHGEGLWALPGGKPEPGEHPMDAARRETIEETSIQGDDWLTLPLWTYDTTPAAGLHYVTLYFACKAMPWEQAVNVEPDKCEEWLWFYRTSLPPVPDLFSPGIRPAVKAAFGE